MFSGARMQRGYGRLQRGNGLGGVLRRLFRSAMPFLIRGGKEIGRQALKTGINVGEDVLAGKNVKTATKNRLAETVGDVVKKASSKIQSGAGGKRKAKSKPGIKRKAQPKPGTTSKNRKGNTSKRKRQYNDIFGI